MLSRIFLALWTEIAACNVKLAKGFRLPSPAIDAARGVRQSDASARGHDIRTDPAELYDQLRVGASTFDHSATMAGIRAPCTSTADT